MYLTKAPNPFVATPRGDAAKAGVAEPARTDTAKSPDKPRFDFYRILPGAEEPRLQSQKSEEARGKGAEEKANAKAGGSYFLQAGAFSSGADAEDQKAKLALLGFEASIQSVANTERGTLHRVRVGPFRSIDEMNQAKTELARNGVDAAVIRNP
jgi:cell division protein FtsN